MNFVAFADHWQTLVGAIIGAGAAFSVWMIAELYRSISERKEKLIFIQKVVGISALEVADAYKAVNDFLSGRFTVLFNEASSHTDSSVYFDGITFFPLLSFQPLNTELLNTHTGSGYVDSKFLYVIRRSRDMVDTIADIKRQFEATLSRNRELALLQKNAPQIQNRQLINDLTNFQKITKNEILGNNIPIYVKELAEAQISLSELGKMSLWRWKLKYDQSFKMFLNKKQMEEHNKDAHNRIDDEFKEKFKNRFALLNSEFDPPLREVPDRSII